MASQALSHQTESISMPERGGKPKSKVYNDVKMTIQNGQTYYKELIKEYLTHLRSGQHSPKGNRIAKCKIVLTARNLGVTL